MQLEFQGIIEIIIKSNYLKIYLLHLHIYFIIVLEDETIKFGSLQNKELSSSIQSENLQTQQQQHPNVYDVLRKEISNVNYGEKLVIDKIDLNNRHCIFQTETNLHLIHLDVKFPLNYPMEPPQFSFLFNTTINQEKGYAIIKRLKNLAQIYASRKEVCLEHCLKAYEQEMVNIIKEEKGKCLFTYHNY